MIKQLLKSLREYKRDSILSPIAVVFEVTLDVAVPIIMAKMIDNGIDAGNMPYIIKTGLILIAVTIFSLLLGALSGKFAASAAAGFAKNLRKDMYDNVQTFSFSNIDKFSPASLITRMTTDISNIQMAYQMAVRMLIRSPIMFVFAMIMAFRINSKLALVFVAVSPILALGLFLIAKNAHPYFVKVFNEYDNLNIVVQENIRSMRVVKSFVREEHEKDKFNVSSKKIFNDYSMASKILAFNNPLMNFCMYACLLVISWLGAHMIVSKTMTTGELVSLFTYSGQILFSLMMLSMVLIMMIISRASAQRISEVLTEKTSLYNPPNPVFDIPCGSVEFENVNFSYSQDTDKLCLKNINFSISSGETVGIIGSTGSAKSTLVHLISRLYDVTEGVVKVGGRDVREYDLDTLRGRVAVVLQKNTLFSGTIKQNLRWGNPDASDEELERVCRLSQAHGFISEFPEGYNKYIEQGGSNVSGGQKQRLCIARALLKNPKILILDDSTSAVDMKTDALIRKALKEELPNTTKFIIAQRIASVSDSDKIIMLDEGKIHAMATHEELLSSNKMYRELYESQNRGGMENDEK